MKTFKQFKAELNIAEAFDNPYPYKLEYVSSHNVYKSFIVLEDKTRLRVRIFRMTSYGKEYYWQVEFMRNGKMELTGGGDQFRIFATIISMIKEFVKKEEPKEIRFEAGKAEEKLFSRMTKRFASNMGYNSKERKESGGITYILTRK